MLMEFDRRVTMTVEVFVSFSIFFPPSLLVEAQSLLYNNHAAKVPLFWLATTCVFYVFFSRYRILFMDLNSDSP
jgi:hypothetical protein